MSTVTKLILKPKKLIPMDKFELLIEMAEDHGGAATLQVFGDKGMYRVKFVCKELALHAVATSNTPNVATDKVLAEIRTQMQ